MMTLSDFRLKRYCNRGMLLATGSLLMFGVMCASCSDDKEAPAPSLSDRIFTGVKELKLGYCGEAMPGKSAHLVPGNSGEASLTLYSDFDLGQLGVDGISGKLPAPGVIPGDISTTLPLRLTAGDGCYLFSGDGKGSAAVFSYSGKIYADSLVMNITDVKLDNLSLAGTPWQLAPIEKNMEGVGFKSLPFHMVWDITLPTGETLRLGDLMSLAVTLPCIPVYGGTAYSSVAQLLSQVVKTVTFLPNGNVAVMYVSTVGGAAHLATLSTNMIQYTVASADMLKLYLNPLSIAGLAMTTGAVSDIYGKVENTLTSMTGEQKEALSKLMPIVKNVVAGFAPQIADGIPMAYGMRGDSLSVYFDMATAVPVVEAIAKTLLNDPAIKQQLLSELQKYPEVAAELPKLMEILEQLPAYLERTTRLEAGLRLIPYKG